MQSRRFPLKGSHVSDRTTAIDWIAVTERLCDILPCRPDTDIPALAERINVDVKVLEDAVEGRSKLATIRVLAAVVRTHGIDPSWVLHGACDAAMHRKVKETPDHELEALIKRMVAGGVH